MDDAGLAFAGVAPLAELVQRGEVSSRELVEVALRRIERLDGDLNAFCAVYPERALAQAAEADRRRRSGELLPLLGVPVAVKDEIDLAGEITSRGTAAVTTPAGEDAEVVQRLRTAGAVILGKTTMPELGLWPFTESITWGVTRNPWDLERTPGGSSGGSAAAVAAGLVPAALAADGARSVRIPAACCGLFGLKPPSGRGARAPPDDDRGGPRGCLGGPPRSVPDAELLYSVLAGLERAPRRPLRIAYPERFPPLTTGRLA